MLGQRLRALRNKAKKTQKDVYDETGIPQTTLSYWENNKSEPAASDIVKLAAALGVSINDLFITDEDEPTATLSKTG